VEIEFDKMQGCGNDFLVIDRLAHAHPHVLSATDVQRLGDRRLGVGFDQLLIIDPPPPHGTGPWPDRRFAAAYRIFNADGTSAGQCGNGARCIAALLHERHGAGTAFHMLSPAGPVAARIEDDGTVAVSMGLPDTAPSTFPAGAAPDGAGGLVLDVNGETVTLRAVSMGNPHAVLMVDDLDRTPVARLGAALQQHRAFPDGVNVSFLQPVSRHDGRLRVVERGVGETPACGSGACAAAVAGMLAGMFADSVALALPGGRLVISWRGPGEDVWLRGAATRVFKGQITL
jgi:diaminopimelate epimerase